MDDLLIGAFTIDLLIKRVRYVLGVCRRNNAKLSPRKFTLNNKVEFGGFRISHDMENDLVLVQPSEEKVQAIQSIQAPKSKQEVQSLVGFLSQLSNFVPECKTVIPNIKRLTSKYNTFKLKKKNFKR